jgi:hypothetical protein
MSHWQLYDKTTLFDRAREDITQHTLWSAMGQPDPCSAANGCLVRSPNQRGPRRDLDVAPSSAGRLP